MVVSLRGNFFLLTVLHQRRCSSSFVLTTVARGAPQPQGLSKYWRRMEEIYGNKRNEPRFARLFPVDSTPEILAPNSW
jgi:hypothetical protein